MAVEHFRSTRDVSTKGVQDVVTKTDFAIDQLFHREVKKQFPDDDVYSEEGDACDLLRSRVWVVDPIDGTSNFLFGVPLFAISVGIYEHGLPVIGAVYDPISKELFFARKGGGAFLNGQPVHVSDTKDLSQALIVRASAHGAKPYEASERIRERIYNKTLKTIRFGSSALGLAYVACGRVDGIYITGDTPPWDVAAGALIVQEAGGLVTHLDGTPWRLGAGDVLATNTRIHREMLKYT